ncbi:hypothetical protein OQI_20135 [Streptomyces pharetrae CZA14]|uniref:Secreted protein n=1 Tax=Streptomyces pharetrae CZA14 TaxID=1144883 RepID=A0ABX3YFN4_9ACTN|nr:hypothetical protein OQI_20135 [Streptomyces pharetrae CZA14]
MNTTVYTLAASGSALGMVVIVVGGVLITAALIYAVQYGIRIRRSEARRPGRGERPTLPESGPVHESREQRAPNEMGGGERLNPHELRPTGGTPSGDQHRPRWDSGSSGSFGGGGPA